MENYIKPSPLGTGREKARDVSGWKRTREKLERYKPSELPLYPQCRHKKTDTFQCKSLTMIDIQAFHHSFYANKDKVKQDSFILKYCTAGAPKRKKEESTYKPKTFCCKYNVFSVCHKRNVAVCRSAFLGILQVKKDRVTRLVREHFNSAELPKEKRGGDHVSHKSNRQRMSVKEFIESLQCMETHYCRSQTGFRAYLSSDLNINKLWRMYNTKVEPSLRVGDSFFRSIYCSEYNIRFGSPATDACSACLNRKETTKREQDPKKRND